MYRILVVTSTFPRWQNDTTPNFVYELCHRIASDEFEIDVLAPHYFGAKRYEKMGDLRIFRYRYFWGRFETLSYDGGILPKLKKNPLYYLLVPFFLLAQFWSIYHRLRRTEYHLIHAHWLIPQGFLCALINRFFIHNPMLLCTAHGGDFLALKNPLLLWVKAWTIAHVDHLTVVSRHLKRIAHSLGEFENRTISVLPMGTDTVDLFKPNTAIRRISKRIIFVGRLCEVKGVHYLIQAIKIIKDQDIDVELYIVGDGPLAGDLQSLVRQLLLCQQVTFCGPKTHTELVDLYSSATIAVVPSVLEGFGLVIIEAMACGCVVVASSLEAICDIIEDGKDGSLVPPKEPAILAEAMLRLLNDRKLAQQLAKTGMVETAWRYDWKVIGQHYQKCLLTLCSK